MIYLDVGAGRIQTWLGRSSTLRGRRGASRLLAEHTCRKSVERWLADYPDVSWNDHAGDVDGIVSLTLADDTSDERLHAVAAAALRHLRDGLPRVELQAAWAVAPSYVDAYPLIEDKLDAGTDVLLDLTVPRSMPFARVCEDCGLDGVVRVGYEIVKDEHRDVCADCETRYDNAGRTTGTRREVIPGPELDLATWLTPTAIDATFQSFPDDFSELARMALGPDGRDGTHTALVYADGNRVGEFIRRAVDSGCAKTELAGWITTANRNAVVTAVRAMCRVATETTGLPVAPHLLAGDDLLVSVPATLAWPLLRSYLPGFHDELRVLVGDRAPQPLPTVSAGIVIAHADYPFTDVVALAGRALTAAKRRTRGAASSVAWLDITTDGPSWTSERPCVCTALVLQRRSQLDALAAITAGQRQAFRTALRRSATEPELTELARRLDATAVLPFLGPDRELPLPTALDLVRWWR